MGEGFLFVEHITLLFDFRKGGVGVGGGVGSGVGGVRGGLTHVDGATVIDRGDIVTVRIEGIGDDGTVGFGDGIDHRVHITEGVDPGDGSGGLVSDGPFGDRGGSIVDVQAVGHDEDEEDDGGDDPPVPLFDFELGEGFEQFHGMGWVLMVYYTISADFIYGGGGGVGFLFVSLARTTSVRVGSNPVEHPGHEGGGRGGGRGDGRGGGREE